MALDGLEAYRATMRDLSGLAQAELKAFFESLDLLKPDLVRDALLEFVPLLVSEYGPIGSEVAVDWYMEQRAVSGARGSFTAVAAGQAIADDDLIEQARYLAGKLWTPEPEAMLGGLLTTADKYVRKHARDTIALNSEREGVAWARVPRGGKTCSWCLVLASRDAVYASAASAGDTRKGGTDYHGHCDCEAVRLGPGDEYPTDYLPRDFYDMYGIAKDRAADDPDVLAFLGTLEPGDPDRDIKGITFAMRREFPEFLKDGVHAH